MSVTPSTSRVSQVSHLEFPRLNKYCVESVEGYLVCASRQGQGWVFIASSPLEAIVKTQGELSFHGVPYKVNYDIGDDIPPAYDYKTNMARRSLGYCSDVVYGSADAAREAAKQACLEDMLR